MSAVRRNFLVAKVSFDLTKRRITESLNLGPGPSLPDYSSTEFQFDDINDVSFTTLLPRDKKKGGGRFAPALFKPELLRERHTGPQHCVEALHAVGFELQPTAASLSSCRVMYVIRASLSPGIAFFGHWLCINCLQACPWFGV